MELARVVFALMVVLILVSCRAPESRPNVRRGHYELSVTFPIAGDDDAKDDAKETRCPHCGRAARHIEGSEYVCDRCGVDLRNRGDGSAVEARNP